MNEEQEKKIKHNILTGNWKVRRYSLFLPVGFLAGFLCGWSFLCMSRGQARSLQRVVTVHHHLKLGWLLRHVLSSEC